VSLFFSSKSLSLSHSFLFAISVYLGRVKRFLRRFHDLYNLTRAAVFSERETEERWRGDELEEKKRKEKNVANSRRKLLSLSLSPL